MTSTVEEADGGFIGHRDHSRLPDDGSSRSRDKVSWFRPHELPLRSKPKRK
jgi:hypothetical protein